MGGHTLDLHQFARDGVTLLGHVQGVEHGKLKLAPDLWDNLASADQHEAEFAKSVDVYIAAAGISAPEEKLPVLGNGFATPLITGLDLEAAGISNVIWATSYSFDFSFVKLPVFDLDGFPIQKEATTAFPGLAFAGLPWLPNAKSGLLYGAAEGAQRIAEAIIQRGYNTARQKRAA
jgi:putative flavoprotein involved in K+ transport